MAPARPIENLDCDEPFALAARKVVAVRLNELQCFWSSVQSGADGDDPAEAVHDMRVASRRLRAALEVFVDAFPKKRFRSVLRHTKTVAAALGEVRDMDVLIERISKAQGGSEQSPDSTLASLKEDLIRRRETALRGLQLELDESKRKRFDRAGRRLLSTEGR